MAMTASEARKNLFPLIEQVNNDRQPIEITSKRGDAVLMSRADYEALEETAYLLRAPANARRLLESLEQARGASASRTTCCSAAGLHAPRLVRLSPLAVGRQEDGEADQSAHRGHAA